jgi:hypothetical protein
MDVRGLSPAVWGKFAHPTGRGFQGTSSGNPAFGFFDDFLWRASTTLYDGYFTLATATGTATRIATDWDPDAPTTTGIGLWQMLVTADNDESIIAFGNALDAPFKLAKRDLAFECRLKCATIAASQYGLFVGLAQSGAQATTKIIGADNAIDNTYDLLGFQKLFAETTAIDAMYQNGGVTKVDGAVKTKLDSIGTLAASTYIKLGFKYCPSPKSLTWFVDGVEKCSLTAAEMAATSFPTNFLTPMIALAAGGTDDYTTVVDWVACAQYE